MRPIALCRVDKTALLEVLLKSYGNSSPAIGASLVNQSELCDSMLSSSKVLGKNVAFFSS